MDTFTLTVMGPQAVLWSGPVSVLEGENSEGSFSIFPDHARFMTVVMAKPLLATLPDGSVKEFTFPLAVLFFADSDAKVYTQPPV